MTDLWLDDSSQPDSETTLEDLERREQSAVFAQVSRWLVLMAGLTAVLYAPLLLVAPDWRVLSVLLICLAFLASVAIVRARFKALTPAVYTVAGLVILGIAGVAPAVTGLSGVLPAAAGLVMTTRAHPAAAFAIAPMSVVFCWVAARRIPARPWLYAVNASGQLCSTLWLSSSRRAAACVAKNGSRRSSTT